jgi:hypothetical protein
MAQVKAITKQIDDNTTVAASVEGNVWVVGQAALTMTTAATSTTPAEMDATVQLGYDPSKIYVEVTNGMTYNTGTVAAPVNTPLATADPTNTLTHTVVLGVMVMNAGSWTTFVQPDANGLYIPQRANVTVPFFYNGMASWTSSS